MSLPQREQMAIDALDSNSLDHDEMLSARHAEIQAIQDLMVQRGTTIPALFSSFHKFIQNPSSVSIETYKRMIDTDDTIGSGVDFLVTCLAARLGRYQHKNPEITTWVNDRLGEIQGGWFNVVKELLSATWAGFAVMEKVWANTPNGFTLSKLVTLPPTTVLFETDRTGELTPDGILQYQRGYSPMSLSGGTGFFGGSLMASTGWTVRPDAFARFGDMPYPIRTSNAYSYMSLRIPRQKCVHYAFDAQGKFGNPYGRSLLRRAYKFYVLKDAILQMMACALDRKGTPLTVVFADTATTLRSADRGARREPGAEGNQGNRGKDVGIDAVKAAAQAFKDVHNDSTIILPGRKGQIYDLDFVPQDSNTESFIAALDFCNKGLMRALLLPSLIFTSGDGSGSYSLGQEHASTFQKILDGMLQGVDQVLIEDVVGDLVRYNFPRSAWETDGLGKFSKRDLAPEEQERMMGIIEKAVNVGVVDTTDLADLNKVRDGLGFPERTTPIASEPMHAGATGGLLDGGGDDDDSGDGLELLSGRSSRARK